MKKKQVLIPTKNLNRQDRKFADLVAKTGDIKGAALAVYGLPKFKTPEEQGREKVLKPEVMSEIRKVWAKYGLDLDLATKKHVEVLKSRRAKKADILNAVKLVYQEHGFAKEEESKKTDVIEVIIKMRKERGLPVPKDLIDAEVVHPATQENKERENGRETGNP